MDLEDEDEDNDEDEENDHEDSLFGDHVDDIEELRKKLVKLYRKDSVYQQALAKLHELSHSNASATCSFSCAEDCFKNSAVPLQTSADVYFSCIYP